MDGAVLVAVRHRARELRKPTERAGGGEPPALGRQERVEELARLRGRRGRCRVRPSGRIGARLGSGAHLAELSGLDAALALCHLVEHSVDVRVRRRRRPAHRRGGAHLHRNRRLLVLAEGEVDRAAAPLREEREDAGRLRRRQLAARRPLGAHHPRPRLGLVVGVAPRGAAPAAPLAHVPALLQRVGEELRHRPRRHRLDAVRVGAQVEPATLHRRLALRRREHNDGTERTDPLADAREERVGVAAGQLVVEEDEVALDGLERRKRLVARPGDLQLHRELRILRLDARNDPGERHLLKRVVLDEQDAQHHRALGLVGHLDLHPATFHHIGGGKPSIAQGPRRRGGGKLLK